MNRLPVSSRRAEHFWKSGSFSGGFLLSGYLIMNRKMPESLTIHIRQFENVLYCDVKGLATYEWCEAACNSWWMQRVALAASEGLQ